MKNKTTAALLAFFLGGFGAQFFYLGTEAGRGVLCLLFFWTLIPAFIAFIDFIRFLVMSDSNFDRRYNTRYTPYIVQVNNSYQSNKLEELQKLHQLKENGILTEAEFHARKQRMLQHP